MLSDDMAMREARWARFCRWRVMAYFGRAGERWRIRCRRRRAAGGAPARAMLDFIAYIFEMMISAHDVISECRRHY